LWYAIAIPQLLGIPDEQSRKDRLVLLADRLGTLSATVSVEAPDCLVFEAPQLAALFRRHRQAARAAAAAAGTLAG
jgi:hypothetical protein